MQNPGFNPALAGKLIFVTLEAQRSLIRFLYDTLEPVSGPEPCPSRIT